MSYRKSNNPIQNDDFINELVEDTTAEELIIELFQTTERIKKLSKKNLNKHNVSAGVELRHELRTLRTIANKLVKKTYQIDKQTIEERRSQRLK